MQLEIPISNTGKLKGDEVVQVYIRKIGDKEGPQRTLRAFKRITLDAGETENLKMTLSADAFKFLDPQTNTMRVVPGEYELLCGGSSDRKKLKSVKVNLQ